MTGRRTGRMHPAALRHRALSADPKHDHGRIDPRFMGRQAGDQRDRFQHVRIFMGQLRTSNKRRKRAILKTHARKAVIATPVVESKPVKIEA